MFWLYVHFFFWNSRQWSQGQDTQPALRRRQKDNFIVKTNTTKMLYISYINQVIRYISSEDRRDSLLKTFEEIAQETLYEDTFLKSFYKCITKMYILAVDLGILNFAVSGDMSNTILFWFVTRYSPNVLRKMSGNMLSLITCWYRASTRKAICRKRNTRKSWLSPCIFINRTFVTWVTML